ncbi:PREDICTED: glucosidase 2 subunit beta isoform X2 [Nicrophorus vespilloides]|uniref:Glucosidase 2 subunit beta n=1 Tax=Nicrophorus vespilloides TaxID=110193 RepID=A0ABM1NIJ5_NICVS|nr:PREDICTED: glucosidase 2 subunit beta isoform X2 [Nicrophorus vespilloides]
MMPSIPKLPAKSYVLCILLIVVCEISTSEVPRPRGVPLSHNPLYNPAKDFVCLDNSLSIPFSQVNDDYCDCPDASDEPGTSACIHGTFFCMNVGHTSTYISSSRVNDGICDCCDGTDEYVKGKCANNCQELGQSAMKEAARQSELLKAGKQIRASMCEMGIKLKAEKKDKLVIFAAQKIEAEKIMREKEQIKKNIEELESAALEQYRQIEEENKRIKQEEENKKNRQEAEDTFVRFDSNKDGIVEVSELQSLHTFDRDRNGEVTVEEAKYFLNSKDSMSLEDFVVEAWPAMKPFLMLDEGLYKPPQPAGVGEVEEVPINGEEPTTEAEFEEEGVNEEEDEEDEEHPEEEEEHEETNPEVTYDEETQNLIEKATAARSEFTEADQSVRDIQSEITKIEEYLNKDFGPDEAFAPLEGECFDYMDYEYIYRLCPFDKATQQQKSGSSDTRLGSWSKWSNQNYDAMLYDRGQSCWNGPQRSTTVAISCGSENKLTSVSEPNRCEYHFTFETPAACYKATTEGIKDIHDEL